MTRPDIEAIEVIQALGLGYHDGKAIEFVYRWKDRGDVEDLRQAIAYLEMLIEQHDSTTCTVRGIQTKGSH